MSVATIILLVAIFILALAIGRISFWFFLYALVFRLWAHLLEGTLEELGVQGIWHYLVLFVLTMTCMIIIGAVITRFPSPYLMVAILLVLAWYVLVYLRYPIPDVLFITGIQEWLVNTYNAFKSWITEMFAGDENRGMIERIIFAMERMGSTMSDWLSGLLGENE